MRKEESPENFAMPASRKPEIKFSHFASELSNRYVANNQSGLQRHRSPEELKEHSALTFAKGAASVIEKTTSVRGLQDAHQ